MKNTYVDSEHRHDARNAWKLTEFTINFTDRNRYKKAVKILMDSEKYKLLRNGRYLYGNTYGYVTFKRREA